MKKQLRLLSSITVIAASHSLEADPNPMERLIRKRFESQKPLSSIPENDEFFIETFFGRSVEVQYSFSYSFSYLDSDNSSSSSPTSLPASPTIVPIRTITLEPTPFSEISNDDTEAPSTNIASPPTSMPSPDLTDPMLGVASSIPSPPGSDTTNILVPEEGEKDANPTDTASTNLVSNEGGLTSAYVIPAVGIVTGVVIVGIAYRSIDKRNLNLQYRNLDCDSNSSFSLQP